MLESIRQVLGSQVTVGRGLSFDTTYSLIGAKSDDPHLQNLHGADLVVSFLGSIVPWPA
jgi:hypothetical protein